MTTANPYSRSRWVSNLLIIALTAATTLLVFTFGWTSSGGARTSRELAFLLSLAYVLLYLRRHLRTAVRTSPSTVRLGPLRRDPWLLNYIDLAVYWLGVAVAAPYCV